MATSGTPGVMISTVTSFFILTHITVHGTNITDGIDVFNVNALGANGEHLDSILAANIQSTNNGILLKNANGVLIDGNSVHNTMSWGIRVENSHDNVITFMSLDHNGLNNPASHPVTSTVVQVFLDQTFWGGILLVNSDHNTLSVSQLSEDSYAGFVLVNSNYNTVFHVDTRYPDYYGGVLLASSHNTISDVSTQTSDFDGLLVRGGGFNNITNDTFSANGPIGAEITDRIVPYFVAGIYLGWGTHDNTVTLNHANKGNTGPSLVADDGTIINPVSSPIQNLNPLNNPSTGNDPGSIPSGVPLFQGTVNTGSGNVFCGNSFPSFAGAATNPNAAC
jgi:parallel beta-helix repeat protein